MGITFPFINNILAFENYNLIVELAVVRRTYVKTIPMNQFTLRLLSESLFYDAEYGISGNLSLIDSGTLKELYVGSYVVEEEKFVIEKAVDWETGEPDQEIGYNMGIEFEEFGVFTSPAEAAGALMELATTKALLPSLTVLFDEEEN